ncbi:hypothetical protein ACLB2K_064748 [Fragaria x ananassa]
MRAYSAHPGAPRTRKLNGEIAGETPGGAGHGIIATVMAMSCARSLMNVINSMELEAVEYPEWLWHLVDKRPALSELRRKDIETLPYEDLKRFVKLDNRARIKENNSLKAKN